MVAQISDGKIALGGLFDSFKVQVNEYAEIINKFNKLDLSQRKYLGADGKANWEAVAKAIGTTDARAIGYFKTLDNGKGTIDNTSASTEGMTTYLKSTGQAFDFAAIKASLLNAALNTGIMIAFAAAIKVVEYACDKANTTVGEVTEKIDELSSSISELETEYKSLKEAGSENLTDAEQSRLQYLEDRIEREKELKELEEARLIREKYGTNFTDYFDKDNYSHKYSDFKDKYFDNIPNSAESLYYGIQNDNKRVIDIGSKLDEYFASQKKIDEYVQQMKNHSPNEQEYIWAKDLRDKEESNLENLLSNIIEEYQNYKTAKIEAEEEIASMQEDMDNPNLSQKDKDNIQKRIDQYNQLIAIADYYISQMRQIDGVPLDTDTDTYYNWFSHLTDEEKDLTHSDEFKQALKEQKESLNGATLSAEDYATVLQSVKNEQNAVDGSVTTSLLSFPDAWQSLKDAEDSNLKGQADDLLKLAEAGRLTAEALQDFSGGMDLIDKTGQSAEQLIKQINALTDASTQLNTLSGQISKMSDMLADKKNGTTASASDLAGFDVEVRGLDSWQEFEKVMGSTTSTMEECQKAANALATEWITSGNYLTDLDRSSQQYYETQLSNMGIENAHVLVLKGLAKAGYELTDAEQAQVDQAIAAREQLYQLQLQEAEDFLAKKDLTNATIDTYNALLQEAEGANISKVALIDLIAQEQVFNSNELSVSSKISSLNELASSYLSAASAAKFMNSVTTSAMGNDSRYYTDSYVSDQWNEALKESQVSVKVNPAGSRDYKAPSSSKDKSKKDSKSEIDWIQRKLDVAQAKIDALKAKFENLFKIKTPKNFSKQIANIEKNLDKTRKTADKTKKSLDGFKLDDSLKKQIQSGKIVDTKKLSSSVKKDVTEYTKLWNKYQKQMATIKSDNKKLNTLRSSRGKYDNLQSQIDQMRGLKKITNEAISAYQKEANKVKLSKALKNKVLSGDYSISEYSSKIQSEIQKYQNYIDKIKELRNETQSLESDIRQAKMDQNQLYIDLADSRKNKSEAIQSNKRVDRSTGLNKSVEYQKKQVKESYKDQIRNAKLENDIVKVKKLQAERQKELNDLSKQEFDNIQNAYEYRLKSNTAQKEAISDYLSLAEARGNIIGKAYYTNQMKATKKDLNQHQKELADLLESQEGIKKYTAAWYEAQDAIDSVKSAIRQDEIEMANIQKQMNELNFSRFDEFLNKITDITDELDFLKGTLSDTLFDDKGNITADGKTAMGLTLMNGDAAVSKRDYYKKQLEELDKMYNNGNGTIGYEDYISKQREYKQALQDSINTIVESKKATIDYVKQGLDAQNEALQKAIDKRKELLDQEKEIKEWQEKIADQNKSISRVQRRLDILSQDDSPENQKTIRELKDKLETLKKEQSDDFYDKSIDDQKESLDTMLENAKTQAENYLKDSEKVFSDATAYINANSQVVASNIEKISKDLGYDISEYITNAWKSGGNAIVSYSNTLTDNIGGIVGQIGIIKSAWDEVCASADRAAQAIVNASNSTTVKQLNNAQNKIQSSSMIVSAKGSKTSVVTSGVLSGMSTALGTIKKKVKKSSYATGGIATDLVKLSGEDGMTFLQKGESVLTPEQTKAFINFRPVIPQLNTMVDMMKNLPMSTNVPQSPVYQIDNRTIVEGVATNEIVKDMANVAKQQAENVIKNINKATYAKGVRKR